MSDRLEEKPCKVTDEELMNAALYHYEELASQAHHWMSSIPKAIRFYFENRDALEQANKRINELKVLLDEETQARRESMDRIEELESRIDIHNRNTMGFKISIK